MLFAETIKDEIRYNGPISVAAFMGMAISHYYANEQPFGVRGDFMTAPEISQMFGELIGAWAADCWVQLGQPDRVLLAECGPGRGTLMADALRATKHVPGFHAAVNINLIETSAALRTQQEVALRGYKAVWHDALESLPHDAPVILLANEFLDALPMRQYQFRGGVWQERVIGLSGDSLHFGLSDCQFAGPEGAEDDAIIEVSEARERFAEGVCERVAAQKGAALFIDYGHTEGYGDTLQAVRNHDYVDVFESVGEADLTSHVDFAALKNVAGVCKICGPVTQQSFLQNLGIGQRAAMLKQNATPEQSEDIDAALLRLTDKKEMGELFKVMAFCSDELNPAGF